VSLFDPARVSLGYDSCYCCRTGDIVTGRDHDQAGGDEEARLPADALRLRVGDKVAIRLPWSEVMMHLGLAGRLMLVELTPTGGAQVRNPDNSPVSFPVLPSEAGIFTRDDGTFYTYPEVVPGPVHRSTQRPGPAAARTRPTVPRTRARSVRPVPSRDPRANGLR
jgi:hypothetical protein